MMFVVLFSPEEILCPWCFKRYFLDGQLYGLMPRKSSTDAVFAYEVVDVDIQRRTEEAELCFCDYLQEL